MGPGAAVLGSSVSVLAPGDLPAAAEFLCELLHWELNLAVGGGYVMSSWSM